MSQLHSVGNLAGVRNVVCVFRTNENNETVEMKSKLFVLFELKMNFALVIHVAVGPNGKKIKAMGVLFFICLPSSKSTDEIVFDHLLLLCR